jgi:hypothetical protein
LFNINCRDHACERRFVRLDGFIDRVVGGACRGDGDR